MKIASKLNEKYMNIKLGISSSNPDCDHNLYAGPCALDSCRTSVHNSGLKTQFAWTRHNFMKCMKISVLGRGTTCLELRVPSGIAPRQKVIIEIVPRQEFVIYCKNTESPTPI